MTPPLPIAWPATVKYAVCTFLLPDGVGATTAGTSTPFLIGKYIRTTLSPRGSSTVSSDHRRLEELLHTVYVLHESSDSTQLIVLTGCGTIVRIPRPVPVGLATLPAPDTNPRRLRQLVPGWFDAVARPRACANGVTSVVVYPPTNTNDQADRSSCLDAPPPALSSGSQPPPPPEALTLTAASDPHVDMFPAIRARSIPQALGLTTKKTPVMASTAVRRRAMIGCREVRLLCDGESIDHPQFAPFVVWLRVVAPADKIIRGSSTFALTNDDIGRCAADLRGSVLPTPKESVVDLTFRRRFPSQGSEDAGDGSPGALITVPVRWMRECAAYTLLPCCAVAVAPRCLYSSVSVVTGSYGCVLEDLSVCQHPVLPGPLSARDAEDPALVRKLHDDSVPTVKRVLAALASLHGRFLSAPDRTPPRLNAGSSNASSRASPSRHGSGTTSAAMSPDPLDLARSAFVDEGATYGPWRAALLSNTPINPHTFPSGVDTSALDVMLRNLYYVTPVVSSEGAAAAVAASEGATPPPSPSSPAPPRVPPRSLHPHLTVVHGGLQDRRHVLLSRSARSVPSAMFVDWRCSGIAPLEVDLVHVFATLLSNTPHRRKEWPALLETHYVAVIRDLYGPSVAATLAPISEIVRRMRDVAVLLYGSRIFDFNAYDTFPTSNSLPPVGSSSGDFLRRKEFTAERYSHVVRELTPSSTS